MCPLHVWRDECRQRRVFVLEIMSHAHGSTITNCCWAIGISSPSQEKSENWSRKQSGIISILSEFLQPNDVALELWIWMADGNFSILVLILVCLHKRVWGFSQAPVCQTVCQIGFLWDQGSICWSSRYWKITWNDRSLCLLQVNAPQCHE